VRLSMLHPRRWDLRLLWDIFMVWVATVNLGLIVFDLTYLVLRPVYRRTVPAVVRLYDPIKGIEPHPLTEQLLADAAQTEQLLTLDRRAPGLEQRVSRLRELTLRMLEENPFERAGQSRSLEAVKVLLARETGASTLTLSSRQALARTAEEFWPTDPSTLRSRLQVFDREIRPLLLVNYFREFNVRGRLTDHFWIIDLPFLTLFVVEFAVRWALAVRRRAYARWFFFPIFNWYDLLGLMPVTELRIFRLFRIASIYMRLRRSEVTKVGKDVLSRGVAYVSNIIAEEISDAVALRILAETQDEIRDGTHVRIFEDTLARHRGRLEQVAVETLHDLVGDENTQQRLREVLRLNLETAVERTERLRAVPLPQAVLRPLVRGLGEAVLDTTLETVTMTLSSEEGQAAVRDLVATVLERLLHGPGRETMQTLSEEISMDVLEQMKAAVAVKKWALPRPPTQGTGVGGRGSGPLPAEEELLLGADAEDELDADVVET
jgi:hypothetical protein